MKAISEHPPKEMYQAGQEIDCQCARCGGSCHWVDCYQCDDGYEDRYDEDPLWYGHELYVCDHCQGHGGWNVCGNTPEWCNANPMPGREGVERGFLEWFTYSEREA